MANLYVLGDLEPAQLADSLEVSRPTVTTAVQRLERDGLVTRTMHPENRSRVRTALTPAGRTAVEDVADDQRAGEIALVSALSPEERATLARLVEKMYAHTVKPS